jgi:hypothetical protein
MSNSLRMSIAYSRGTIDTAKFLRNAIKITKQVHPCGGGGGADSA